MDETCVLITAGVNQTTVLTIVGGVSSIVTELYQGVYGLAPQPGQFEPVRLPDASATRTMLTPTTLRMPRAVCALLRSAENRLRSRGDLVQQIRAVQGDDHESPAAVDHVLPARDWAVVGMVATSMPPSWLTRPSTPTSARWS
jgi:hypothetical protein